MRSATIRRCRGTRVPRWCSRVSRNRMPTETECSTSSTSPEQNTDGRRGGAPPVFNGIEDKGKTAMANIRFGDNDNTILASSSDTFFGEGGDDVYVLSQDLIPANASIEISDTEGANRLRLLDGLEI